MKRIILFITAILFTASLFAQTGTGWAQQRAKVNFRDSVYFMQPLYLGGAVSGYILIKADDPAEGVIVIPGSASTDTLATKAYARSVGGEGGSGMIYPGSGIAVSTGSTWGASVTNNSTNWNTAYTDRLKWDGGATGLTPATGRTSLGATTAGGNIFTLTNPSAVTYIRINADNTITTRSASEVKVDLSLSNVTDESKATMFTSPTFTGTVVIPTPFTLGAISVTSTGTQLNYLSGATGTTGTGSLVLSTSPTITGHPTIEGVTSTGATGSGDFVFATSPTFTGTVTLPSGTSIGDVSSTEIGYVNGVTSAIQTQFTGKVNVSDTASMLNNYLNNSTVSVTEAGYLNGVTSAIQTQIDGKITKGIIDSVNSVGTDAQFFSTTGDTLLPYIPYEDRITSNPYFKGQTNTDSLLIHGAYAERTTVNKLKIGGNNSPGTSATPAGDVGILLDAYMGTDTTMSANHIARIRSQNMMSSHYGSNLIFDTHTSLQDTYGGSTYLLPAMILDYNGSVITPFRNTGTVSNSGGITHAQLARLMYYDEAAATDITADPQIVCNAAYARDGTIITIVGSSDTNTLKLDDGTGLQLAGGVSFTLGVGDTITLVFSSTLNLWVEISRSDN